MTQYPKKYFEDEYRDGFLVERTMKCAWAAQLEVLRHISDICERHGLKYFAFFGTLLGAIRHHGYIPWDDDIDIAMLRSDYQEFLKVCKAELPEEYCVLNCYDYPEWDEVNIRITNGAYIDISEKRMSEYYGCPFSVGVDIYPLDILPDDPEVLKQEKEILNLIANTNDALTSLENETEPNKQNEWRKITIEGLQAISNVLEFQFDYNANIHSQLYQLFDQMCQVFSQEEGQKVTTMPTFIKGAEKMVFHKLWLRESIDFPFEYGTIKVPVGYEACLWARFGVNYMVPRQIKASHDYPFYKQQKELLEERDLWADIEQTSKSLINTLHAEENVLPGQIQEDSGNRARRRKKTICYRVSIVEFLQNKEGVLEKIRRALDIFSGEKDSIDMIFVPDEEIMIALEEPKTVEEYRQLLEEIEKNGCLKYVDENKVQEFVTGIDAFYGDGNSWIYYFKKMKKPVMVQNIKV